MVALSIVPARYIPETLLWIASDISLLYFSFFVMANLHPAFLLYQFVDLLLSECPVGLGHILEFNRLLLLDVGDVFLGEQIFIIPNTANPSTMVGGFQAGELASSFRLITFSTSLKDPQITAKSTMPMGQRAGAGILLLVQGTTAINAT
jgi:hypothetical protein